MARKRRSGVWVEFPKVWDRSRLIESSLVGKSFKVYTGKAFIVVKMRLGMVGYKFGDFVWTRKMGVEHKKKSK